MAQFHCRIRAELPAGMDPEVRADFLERDRLHLAGLRDTGALLHQWRAAGEQLEFLVLESAGHEGLHELLAERPLFPFLRVEVTALRPGF